jgi:glyoxylase-like metal-dependent hydrolase (beta-lactamase superfamily II)
MRLTDEVALVGSGDARLSGRHDCNVYAVDAPEGTVLVDTGAGESVPFLLDRAEAAFGPVEAALVTHAHADHSQGGPACRDRGVEVVASEATAALLESGTDAELGLDAARRDGLYPADYEFARYSPDRTFAPPATLTVAGRRFEAVPLAGHASDHVVYLTDGPDRTYCLVGDAVYPDGSISLLNVPGSSLADYRESIGNLAGRDVDALLPGHGLPLLADGDEAVATAAEALRGMSTPPSRT